MKPLILFALLSTVAQAQLQTGGATASFRGALPPNATTQPSNESVQSLQVRLGEVTREFVTVKTHRRAADAEIFLKAVRYAMEFQEWYGKNPDDDVRKATVLLDEAASRIQLLKKDQTPWMDGSGQKILGFYSKIDDSPQPYGVELPKELVFGPQKPSVPMWIWLHGRGDTDTDMHFVFNRLQAKKQGQFQPAGTIVLHPFGRYCNGWKSAGETDVLEARDDAISRFNIDSNRIAIAGFSMGGAGAWHIGAHFADQWACIHTGAGFVDVQRYQKVTQDKLPPWYEQKLWGVYDVPNYARNLLNVPLVCYSGELDPQRDSAEYMLEVLDKEGLHPPHFIGPGMGHKYHPDVLKEIQAQIEKAVAKGRDPLPTKLFLQTRTLAYSSMHWLQIAGMKEQWVDARVDAVWDEKKNEILVNTKNVSQLNIRLPRAETLPKIKVDGTEINSVQANEQVSTWHWQDKSISSATGISKKPMLQGPMDDGFKSRFMVVLPDALPDGTAVDKWARAEADHFLVRWRSLMRGDALVRKANEVNEQDMQDCHIAVWGTPNTNSLIRKLLDRTNLNESVDMNFANLLTWNDQVITLGNQRWPSSHCVPMLCYPNPFCADRYVILNSGLTFREAHDKTNSLQNPKLPDWAVLDVSAPPTSLTAGKVLAADFFDSQWKWIPRAMHPNERE